MFYHIINKSNMSFRACLSKGIAYDIQAGVIMTPGVDLETDRLSALEKETNQAEVYVYTNGLFCVFFSAKQAVFYF